MPPARVFAAWADPVLKAGWFADPGAEHSLDFRVGGRELYRSAVHTYDARFSDIVADERIVLSFEMYRGATLLSLSVATVVFEAAGEGTRLTYTEQATFLDGGDTRRTRAGGRDRCSTASARACAPGPGRNEGTAGTTTRACPTSSS